jgi:protein required for attachment to host cells
MQVRIVVADEGEARFYDTSHQGSRLRQVGRLEEPKARLRDRDFKSDRPGRVFDHAPTGSGRRGGVAHHAISGEGQRQPSKREAQLFARRIVQELEGAQRERRFERIVLMAGPAFLGMLRQALPKRLRSMVAAEVPKDLVHEADAAVQAHLPREVFNSPG